jgi:hypothetical protein
MASKQELRRKDNEYCRPYFDDQRNKKRLFFHNTRAAVYNIIGTDYNNL